MINLRVLAAACAAAWLSITTPAFAAIAIVDVSVVPMDRARVLEHQTVIIDGGVIRTVGSARGVRVPAGTEVIDGRGLWLIPGLADMHTHIDDAEDFPPLLAAGVTTTLNMGGSSERYRREIAPALRARQSVGPYPLVAMMIDGPGDDGGSALVPATEEEARTYVRSARARGYDYVKIYSRLQPPIFEAIMDEARRQRLPVIGHVVRSVGLERGLQAGQAMLAHGEEYLTVFDDAPPNDARIPELVRLSTRYHVTVTANVAGITAIAEQWGNPDAVTRYLERPEALRMRETLREEWRGAAYRRLPGTYTAEAGFVQRLTTALYRAHVPILVGTDTPDVPGVPPGASVIDEILMLETLGFTRFDALAAATREPGRFVQRTLPRAQRFGQIKRGYRADLLLLRVNPLNDITALRAPVRVMANGFWYEPD